MKTLYDSYVCLFAFTVDICVYLEMFENILGLETFPAAATKNVMMCMIVTIVTSKTPY